MEPHQPLVGPPKEVFLTRREYYALLRKDFFTFILRVYVELHGEVPDNNFHIELMAAWLDVVRSRRRRLAIALPPRSLKSVVVSIGLPAWLLGHNPKRQIICASYGQELAEKLAADCRQVMQSEWYKKLFPKTRLAQGRQALNHFQTTKGGVRIATSVGGALTGFGADIIIVDDPTKPEEVFSEAERKRANHWVRHTLFARLNNKRTGSIILVQQRLHEEDMIGHVLTFAEFDVLSFPAIAQADELHVIETPFGHYEHLRREGEALHPSREPLEVLAELKAAMGNANFAAQYLQMPAPPGGNFVDRKSFGRHTYTFTDRRSFDQIYQSWDTASKAGELNDYSVCTTWGVIGHTAADRKFYLLHVERGRFEYPVLRRLVIDHARHWNAHVILVEDAASGAQLLQELIHEAGLNVRAVKPVGDKVMRLRAQTAYIDNGQVFIPADAPPWLEPYLHELEMFPNGKYADQVDSTSQALGHIGPPTSFDTWGAYLQGEIEANERRALLQLTGGVMPTIRLAHRHHGTRVMLSSGRMPELEPDGTFLVTEGEVQSALGCDGVYRVEDG